MAEEQGARDWTDMIPQLVEVQREAPPSISQPSIPDDQIASEPESVGPTTDRQGTLLWNEVANNESETGIVAKPSRYRGVELPQDPVVVQNDNRVLWNLNHGVSAEKANFYTIGYSGRDIERFIKLLETAEVSTVVDVRSMPVSQYKPDFSKDNLRNHLHEHGVKYDHLPNLGVPRDVRQQAAELGDRGEIWKWYQDNVISNLNDDELTTITDQGGTVAFMCTEIDPESCHRHLIFLELEAAGLKGQDL